MEVTYPVLYNSLFILEILLIFFNKVTSLFPLRLFKSHLKLTTKIIYSSLGYFKLSILPVNQQIFSIFNQKWNKKYLPCDFFKPTFTIR